MDLLSILVVVCLGVLAWLGSMKQKGRKPLPPGPYQFPIVGNLFQVGENPQQLFAQLSKKYGPLMSLRFGSVLNVVVTSPQLAKEILTKPGFAGRHAGQAAHVHDLQKLAMIFMPVSSKKWKFMRRIIKEQIFANPSLEASQKLRQENLHRLLDYVNKLCSGGQVVNIRDATFTSSINHISATLFSTQTIEFGSEETAELRQLVDSIANIFGEPNLADFFPVLEHFDPQSVKRRSGTINGRMLGVMKGHVDQRVEDRRRNPNSPKKDDFLETLVDICLDNKEFNLKDITCYLLELFVGGAGPSMATVEWTMAELLLHPEKMAKASSEVRAVMGDKKVIDDSDISKLPYLEAAIKEVFRLHPPASLLLPRSVEEDKEVNGYFIPKDTRMVFNVWAMGRDPSIWPNAERFEPERFLGNNVDYKGTHFELIPFGAGRRICPGLPLAHRMIHATLAAFLRNFDWKFAPGEEGRNREVFGSLTLRREAPLKAFALKPS